MLDTVAGHLQPISLCGKKKPDILLFYPTSGSKKPGSTKAAQAAIKRFSDMGLEPKGRDLNSLVARLMLEASRRGVMTNAPGADGRWGRKDQLEFALRSYTRTTGRKIERPETYVMAAPQIPVVLRSFAERGLDCITKPANRARGEGLQIVRSNTVWKPPSEKGNFIIQELVKNPFLIDGYKADLRCYILIDTEHQKRSRRLPPIFVRLAATPYVRGGLGAEITNTSYRRRLGLRPKIYPLDQAYGIPREIRNKLLIKVDALTDELISARFWWSRSMVSNWQTLLNSRRMFLWGIDVLPSYIKNDIKIHLLEVNVHPQLFRGHRISDSISEDILRDEFLPELLNRPGDGS